MLKCYAETKLNLYWKSNVEELSYRITQDFIE